MATAIERPPPRYHRLSRMRLAHRAVGALTEVAAVATEATQQMLPKEFVGPAHTGAVDDKATTTVGAAGLYAVGWGALSYVLFTGRHIVSKAHPVLGTIAGLFALGNAATAILSSSTPSKAA